MAILAGDIKLVASQVMDDVPEGGGAPTSTVILDGASNAVFPDVSELDRAGGRVGMRKLHISVQTDNTDTYLGSNVIVAEPPTDPNVSITIFSTRETFDTRESAASRVASYLTRGPVWPAVLYENHVAGQRTIQLFQRPGTAMPPIGRTLVLVYREGFSDERVQYVRVTRAESEIQIFYDLDKGDYPVMITSCSLSDALRFDFPGSTPNKAFSLTAGKTLTRDTTVADAATYFGVEPLALAASIGDVGVKARSIYTQLVPSSRTESIALDQKPAAQRSFTLASAPRLIEVGLTPHSTRIRVGQENRGFSWVNMLRPRPAPGTLVVSYRVQGSWYTVEDDGLGGFTGSGVGTVNYTTGSIALTFPALPDADSSIVYSWGENTAFTNRAGDARFRAPEFAWALPNQGIKPGSVTVNWESGGVLKSVADDGVGYLTGDGTGQVNYASGKVFLRPAAMIDAGGEFSTDYTYSSLTTLNVAAPALDAGGFGIIPLADVPFPGTITVKWITVRNVSSTSGASDIASSRTTPVVPAPVPVVTTDTPPGAPPVYSVGPVASPPPGIPAPAVETVVVANPPPGTQMGFFIGTLPVPLRAGLIAFTFKGLLTSNPDGVYTLEFVTTVGAPTQAHSAIAVDVIDVPDVPAYVYIRFDNTVLFDSPAGSYYVKLLRPDGTLAGISPTITVPEGGAAPVPVASVPTVPLIPAIKTREPNSTGATANGVTFGVYYAGFRVDGYGAFTIAVPVMVEPSFDATQGYYYDPPERTDLQWSAVEVSNGKMLVSMNGVSRIYKLYAAAIQPMQPSYTMYANG